ncbi:MULTISPECIES: hypothetical protein [unclassified Spirosoma]|uniref:hypothetical protein n=1 Tax=unclassified Spirosoma TaxID=2621999 RepID=UPI0009636C0A|nr:MULTISPECIES: hypothetical protein [unclassified Spirosoma]MBN8821983.1 hypothetical protein [Spirosoma sp.]OJW80397.1 MAG: hypothetical protein BGO59_33445 [Spirosoma sp. 48-14]
MDSSSPSYTTNKPIRTILRAGVVAGVLDALAAMIMTLVRGGNDPLIVWKYVASGAFGPNALTDGPSMIFWGLAFHFLIAFSFASLFYAIYPSLRRFIDSTTAMGLLYGIPVWVIMNLIVIPASRIKMAPFELSRVTIGMGILMICVGLPIALIVSKNYSGKA